jgi:hypothetical protein
MHIGFGRVKRLNLVIGLDIKMWRFLEGCLISLCVGSASGDIIIGRATEGRVVRYAELFVTHRERRILFICSLLYALLWLSWCVSCMMPRIKVDPGLGDADERTREK